MNDYDNTNRGALFRNDRKQRENQPDHTGTLNVAGEEYWLSAWVKEDRNGRKYFSLSVTSKTAQEQQQRKENFNDFDQDEPVF